MPTQRPTLQYCDCDSSEMESNWPTTTASSAAAPALADRFTAMSKTSASFPVSP